MAYRLKALAMVALLLTFNHAEALSIRLGYYDGGQLVFPTGNVWVPMNTVVLLAAVVDGYEGEIFSSGRAEFGSCGDYRNCGSAYATGRPPWLPGNLSGNQWDPVRGEAVWLFSWGCDPSNCLAEAPAFVGNGTAFLGETSIFCVTDRNPCRNYAYFEYSLYSQERGETISGRDEINFRVHVPEPGSLALFGVGLTGLALRRPAVRRECAGAKCAVLAWMPSHKQGSRSTREFSRFPTISFESA